jgi:hypothetical protein
MDYLLDSEIINIMYDDLREPDHQKVHLKLSKLANEDRVLTFVLVIYEMEFSFFNAPLKRMPKDVANGNAKIVFEHDFPGFLVNLNFNNSAP